jgi:hypothetical protein
MRKASYSRKIAITLAVAGLCAGALMVSTGAVGALRGAEQTKAPKDCQKPRVKPTRIVLACGDFSAYVNDLHWHHWGSGFARGHGKLRFNDCTPNCVSGKFHTYPVKAALLEARMTRCDGRRVKLFNHMDLTFPHRKPSNAEDWHHNDLFCNPHSA